ncbi:MAG: WD40/YVTN/BNR-like repeat-containing protein, partial [Candidatus Heimdallarchaeota archaeon]
LPISVAWYSIAFTNDLTGYVVGSGKILKTIDGGSNWSNIPNPSSTSRMTKVYCVNTNDMETYIVGGDGLILKTEDGGLTWENYSVETTIDFLDVSFDSSAKGYIGAQAGYVYKTEDYGVNWAGIRVVAGSGRDVNAILATGNDIVYAGIVAYDVYKTVDAGVNWSLTSGNVTFWVNGFASCLGCTSTIIVVGASVVQNNFIFKTTNAFTSKTGVASELNLGGNSYRAAFGVYSSVTVLRFSIAGATTTVTAKLLLTDDTVIATKSNLLNGINSFSNVVENIYKIRIIDDGDNTCIFTSDLYNYSISYCVTLATTSQINSEKTSIVYWKVVVIDGSLVNKDIVVSGIISPENDLVTFTIS